MINIPKIEIQPYVEIAWRRKWWIVCPLILCLVGGALFIMSSAKMYKASTLILVESQRVPSSYVRSTISESLSSRLRTITQQVNSRTNLESIIKEFGLLASNQASEKGWLERIKGKLQDLVGIQSSAAGQKEDDKPSMLSLVEMVRKKIDVKLRGGNRAFEISFDWKDPQVAADVANAIASQFIEQNLRVREEMAMGTTNFLTSEVERMRKKLVQKEQALEKFKKEHMGRLPNQLQSNLNVLSQLKDERNNLEKRIDMDKQQIIMLKNQISALEGQEQNTPEQIVQKKESELSQLKKQFKLLRSKYTEKHPDVIDLKRQIVKIQNEQKNHNATDEELNNPIQHPDSVSPKLVNQKAQLNGQLQMLQSQIKKYEKQIAQINADIQNYRDRVEATSKVELQLKDLQRDYDAVNDRYQDLLSKKLSAQMSEEMEKRQKGEQFRVVDPAVAPTKPFKPNVQKIMVLALFMGLGLGGGLAYLKESLDPGFYTQEEIEAYLDTEVIVSFPIEGEEKKRKRKKPRA